MRPKLFLILIIIGVLLLVNIMNIDAQTPCTYNVCSGTTCIGVIGPELEPNCPKNECSTDADCGASQSCTCRWRSKGCGTSPCESYEMKRRYVCDPPGCDKDGIFPDAGSVKCQLRCVQCGGCSSWIGKSCGGGSCADNERRQTRTCPSGSTCKSERCVSDPSCGVVTCTDSDNDGFAVEGGTCGIPVDCDDGDPSVNPGASEICDNNVDDDCDNLVDSKDSDCCFCGGWVDDVCGSKDCDDDEMRQTRSCTPSNCRSEERCVYRKDCAVSEEQCCVNPDLEPQKICSAISLHECCPQLSYDCVNNLFKSVSCAQVEECALGCCCPIPKMEPEMRCVERGDKFIHDVDSCHPPGISLDWFKSYEGEQEKILALHEFNGKLYAGQGGDGDILVYDGDQWIISYDGQKKSFSSFEVYQGKLYAGQGDSEGSGDIYVFDGSNWELLVDTPYDVVSSMMVYDDELYIGFGNHPHRRWFIVYEGDGEDDYKNWFDEITGDIIQIVGRVISTITGSPTPPPLSKWGDVWKYDGNTWSLVWNGEADVVSSMAVFNGKLYWGQGIDHGDIYGHDGKSVVKVFDGSEDIIHSLAVYNDKLYAGEGTDNAAILEFGEAARERRYIRLTKPSIIYNNPTDEYDSILSLTSFGNRLYAGAEGSGGAADIFVYDGSDIVISYDDPDEHHGVFALAEFKGALYAGLGIGLPPFMTRRGAEGDIIVYKGLTYCDLIPEDLVITIISPKDNLITNETSIVVNATTNVWAVCSYGDTIEASEHTGNFGISGTVHKSDEINLTPGNYTYYVKCKYINKTGDTVEKIASTSFTMLSQLEVEIDTTPPGIPIVDDSSDISGIDTNYTYYTDRLRVSWSSEDNESGIAGYMFWLLEFGTDKLIHNAFVPGESHLIPNLNLSDNTTYYFRVSARNNAGLWSNNGSSDGITVDTSLKPVENTCANGELDSDESDVDCGGRCGPCGLGKSCVSDDDCKSGLACLDGVCSEEEEEVEVPKDRCSNGRLDIGETDVDCGGVCIREGKLCDLDDACEFNSDCESGSCVGKLCAQRLGECVGGQTVDCVVGLCEGTRTCVDGVWGDCVKLDPECGVRKQGLPQWLKLLIWLLILVVLAVAGYFGLRYYQEKKKPPAPPPEISPALLRRREEERRRKELEEERRRRIEEERKKRVKALREKLKEKRHGIKEAEREELFKPFEVPGKKKKPSKKKKAVKKKVKKEEDIFKRLRKETEELGKAAKKK